MNYSKLLIYLLPYTDASGLDKASGKNAQRTELEALIRFVRAGDTVIAPTFQMFVRLPVPNRSHIASIVGFHPVL